MWATLVTTPAAEKSLSFSAPPRTTYQVSRLYGTQAASTIWSFASWNDFARTSTSCRIQRSSIIDNRPVVAKFTEFPWQTPYLEPETAAYQWIEGSDIVPRFLSHLTEEDRVIGFVLEYIDEATPAGPEDLAACQSILKKQHSLGVKHGDINKHNFLVQPRHDGSGRVILLDFESANRDASVDELEAEYQHLTESLADPSLRGAVPRPDAALREQMAP
ncbi:hypothetical protein B0H63DRAFT_464151 [Podospora didyma]|uniref:Aminoglycoside phosphotransferase domain-containing protein n=1 Tax=Podospora didyma TaxID=330526 RepID=A0AAE0U3N5_9PEZI|nr:hypothetical protein B0H63DRAFT_464151 [Podospora didyma]